MTPQEIAERALAYGEPKEPTIVFVALREAASRYTPEQSDTSLHPAFGAHTRDHIVALGVYANPGWMA